jgi:hypothetical protein
MVKTILFYGIAILIPVGVVLAVLFSLELFFRMQDRRHAGQASADSTDLWYYESHPIVGRQLRTGGHYTVRHQFPDIGTFDSHYTLDEDRKRRTPGCSEAPRKCFLAAFGCSMVFGSCVEDDQTLPYYLGERLTDFQPYNFGESACATQHMYHRLATQNLPGIVKEERGIGFFLYLDIHLRRVIPAQPEFNIWAHGLPYFEPDATGGLVYRGSLRDAAGWRARLFDWTARSALLRHGKVTLPLRYTDADYNLVVAQIAASAKLFREQFPGSAFVVLTWPKLGSTKPIEDRLAREGIPFVNLLEASKGGINRWPTFADGHLIATSNEYLATLIARVLDSSGLLDQVAR